MSLSKQLPKALKEIRLHLCQTGQASAGVRQFIKASYPAIKAANPDLKFLIREASGVDARAFARFERGIESQTSLADMSEGDVNKALEALVSRGPGMSSKA